MEKANKPTELPSLNKLEASIIESNKYYYKDIFKNLKDLRVKRNQDNSSPVDK
jgi:hypothetical protein